MMQENDCVALEAARPSLYSKMDKGKESVIYPTYLNVQTVFQENQTEDEENFSLLKYYG